MSVVERSGDATVLVVDDDGPALDGRVVRDLIGDAMGEGADLLVLPVGRLSPAFWELESGLAGDLFQLSVNYHVRIAIVGELPEAATGSRSFTALVRESNAGSQHWFMASMDALRVRLGA